MPKSYAELLVAVRARTREVSLDELSGRLLAKEAYTLVDVREPDEVRGGYIPGAIAIPRGLLEMQIEKRVPDKTTRLVTYCTSGNRSAFAARALGELGYTHVETANPGFKRWKELGYPVESPPHLSDAQRERYSRHLLLPEIGERGQAKLLESKVLLIGAGGLGSPAGLYLAAAGVGSIGLVDADVVDAGNLQRQVLHATSRVGQPKVVSAEKTLKDLNPDVQIVGYRERLTRENVERLFADYDLVVDGSDNFPTRYLINDASVWLGKAVVHGSIFRFDGQVSTFVPDRAAARFGTPAGPCYRCLFPEPPPPELAPSCQEAGVLGILPGVVGLLQATEALKLLLNLGAPLVGRLLTYDALKMKFRELSLKRAPDCPVCGPSPSITSYVDYEGFCAANSPRT